MGGPRYLSQQPAPWTEDEALAAFENMLGKALLARAMESVTITQLPDQSLNEDQAAAFLQCSPDSVRRYASRGLIPGRKVAGLGWRFSQRALDQWLAGELDAPADQQRADDEAAA